MQAFFRKSTHHIIRAYALLFSFLSHFTTKRSTVKSTYSTHVPLIKKQIKILLKDGLTEMIRYIKLFHAYIHFFLHHWTWYHMYGVVCNHVPNSISLNFEIVLLKINFFNVFGSLWCADVKNNFFFKKKHYFDAFPCKKHFEKKLLPHPQTPPITICTTSILSTLIYILSQNI
jgi:hypothetical protein